jgi:RHS repeat-associated protein
LNNATGTSKQFDAVDSVFGFAGREQDKDTGLYYNRARWFDPKLGRFISEDPIAADINSYRYAGNNPIDRVDPSGLDWSDLFSGWDFASFDC